MRLSRQTLMRVFLRSLLLQAAWNFERMQNLGFAYALVPAVNELYPEAAARDEAMRRHLEVFNTHPYMASIILGVVLKLEEDLASGALEGDTKIRSIKVGLLGSYGAIGDGLVWAGIKPLAMLLGVAAGIFVSPWAGLAVFLVAYNLAHLALRVGGFSVGYTRGIPGVLAVRDWNLPRWTKRVRTTALVILGGLAAWWVLRTPWGEGGPLELLEATAFLVGGYGVWRYLGAGRSATSLVYWVTLVAVVFSSLATIWGSGS